MVYINILYIHTHATYWYIAERGPLADKMVYPFPILRSINNVRGTQCFGLWSFLSTVVAGCCLYAALHYSPDTAVRTKS